MDLRLLLSGMLGLLLCVPVSLRGTAPLTPADAVVVFDLHDVVMRMRIGQAIRCATKFPTSLLVRYGLNLKFWKDIRQTVRESDVSDHVFERLGSLYPELVPYIPQMRKLMNQQEPIQKTVNIIQQLVERGYHVYLASNIGEQTLKDLCQVQDKICSLFSGVFVPTAETQWVAKPQLRYFQLLRAFIMQQEKASKTIVFIDDKSANVESARVTGMQGILFKQADDLSAQLRVLGIML
jgi:FMN phosphatase YigB (HAD superfamily)